MVGSFRTIVDMAETLVDMAENLVDMAENLVGKLGSIKKQISDGLR